MTHQKTGHVNRKILCVGENLLENKDNSEENEKSKEIQGHSSSTQIHVDLKQIASRLFSYLP